MRIKIWHMGLIVLIVIFGGIAGTMALNFWNTAASGGNQVPVTFTSGEFAGEYNPADIRGSYSFGHISELWEIPLIELGTAFALGVIENPADFKCMDLHESYTNLEEDIEIGTGSVKAFVALYTGLPFTLADDEYLPQSAVELLKSKGTLTEDQVEFLNTHSIDISELEIIEPSTATGEGTTTKGHEESTQRIIKGNTTLN